MGIAHEVRKVAMQKQQQKKQKSILAMEKKFI